MGTAKLLVMSDISENLLDALMELPAVQSLWLRPNQRRGSHFSRADEDLLFYAPNIDELQWQQAMDLVAAHEKWHLITVLKVLSVPVEGAIKARPRRQ